MEGQKLTILKKKGKGGAAGHHGGSWKVAFADFMTAMMAFFLLMWLLSMGPQKKKEELAHYFKTYSLNLFESGGGSAPPSIPLTDTPGGPPDANPQANTDTEAEPTEVTDPEMEEMKTQLQRQINQRLTSIKDQVKIGKFDGGLKIDIMDKDGQPMFEVGSTELTENANKVLAVVADTIRRSTKMIEIEGHTDARAYSGKQKFTNWELSTARASAARIALEKYGLNSVLLMRVSGYADTDPIIKDNPMDPRNRRISLRLLYPKAQPESLPAPEIAPELKQEVPPPDISPHQ
ncbi:MAG: flagellar motor protein MotB [Desulfobulbaceae bacterium]|nr:flagellar motor protein MotB [Desulfobulbaceae bacterium]